MSTTGRPPAHLMSSRFLWNYRSEGRPAARLERVLAIGRAFLTVSGLIAIYVDPTEPARLAELTYAVLFGYTLYSLIVVSFVHRATRFAPRDGEILHGIDIFWTAALTFVSSGPGSPFFLFFLFVQLAAAYRWGFRETVLTTAVTVGIFLFETGIAGARGRRAGPGARAGRGPGGARPAGGGARRPRPPRPGPRAGSAGACRWC